MKVGRRPPHIPVTEAGPAKLIKARGERARGVGRAQQGLALVAEFPRSLVVAHFMRRQGEPDQ